MNETTYDEAIFAMGCFWCAESAFYDPATQAKRSGIIDLSVGYTGGASTQPTYHDHNGHQEAIKIVFDPHVISYAQLLDIFWRNIDPFDQGGQFYDRGVSYVPVLFFQNQQQRQSIEHAKEKIEQALGRSVAVAIKPASPFYHAEDYHQNYKLKNPMAYDAYRRGSQRDQRLADIWQQEDI